MKQDDERLIIEITSESQITDTEATAIIGMSPCVEDWDWTDREKQHLLLKIRPNFSAHDAEGMLKRELDAKWEPKFRRLELPQVPVRPNT